MELAAQLEALGAELFLDWIPRGSDREADRLADGDWSGFDESLRVHAELGEVRWLVLSELLDAGQRFFQATKKERRGQKRAGQDANAAWTPPGTPRFPLFQLQPPASGHGTCCRPGTLLSPALSLHCLKEAPSCV